MYNWNLKRWGEREWAEALYKKMMPENFLKLIEDNDLQIQNILLQKG